MTVRRYCTCKVGDLRIGIAIDRVQEVLGRQTVTPVPLAHHSVIGLLNLRSQIVTAIDARRRLGLPASTGDQSSACVIIRADDEIAGLVVDAAGDVVEVAEEGRQEVPLTVNPDLRQLLTSAYQLDDGLLLVLDTDRVISVPAK